jgi:hypothetical protein
MNPRQLGRLKAQGADVPAKLLSRKAKKRKTEGGEAKEVEAEGAETKETTEVAAEAEAAPGA